MTSEFDRFDQRVLEVARLYRKRYNVHKKLLPLVAESLASASSVPTETNFPQDDIRRECAAYLRQSKLLDNSIIKHTATAYLDSAQHPGRAIRNYIRVSDDLFSTVPQFGFIRFESNGVVVWQRDMVDLLSFPTALNMIMWANRYWKNLMEWQKQWAIEITSAWVLSAFTLPKGTHSMDLYAEVSFALGSQPVPEYPRPAMIVESAEQVLEMENFAILAGGTMYLWSVWWLRQIINRLKLSQHSTLKVQELETEQYENVANSIIDPSITSAPEQIFLLREKVRHLLSQLTAKERRIIELKSMDHTYQEIAQLLHISEREVKSELESAVYTARRESSGARSRRRRKAT